MKQELLRQALRKLRRHRRELEAQPAAGPALQSAGGARLLLLQCQAAGQAQYLTVRCGREGTS